MVCGMLLSRLRVSSLRMPRGHSQQKLEERLRTTRTHNKDYAGRAVVGLVARYDWEQTYTTRGAGIPPLPPVVVEVF